MRKLSLLIGAILLLTTVGIGAQTLTGVFCYVENDDTGASDITNGGTRPAYLAGTTRDTRDCEYNPSSTEGFPTVLIVEDDNNDLFVCRADNGSVVRTIASAETGDGTVDPYGVAVSEDGVIFINGFARTVVYFADDSGTATKTTLIAGATVHGAAGNSRAIHATGSVVAGTCRLYWSAGNDIVVYDVGGTLPTSLTATLVATYTPDDGGTAISDCPGIAGTVNTIHLTENAGNIRDVMVVQDGGDTIIPSADDTYVAGTQAIADNQTGQIGVSTGISVIDDPIVSLGGTTTLPGVYAIYEAGGAQDGVAIASLGTDTVAGEAAPPPLAEDQEPDGWWDGGATRNINSANLDGGVSAGLLGATDVVNIWFVSAGADGAFGRLNVPGAVPVELSVFSTN
ncbi:hypothetical protein JXA47_11605 [Candidatus Sumerlaeota bacterium]|nr:hypothetical protein [Candidatus Sumerlaeota bacterium]